MTRRVGTEIEVRLREQDPEQFLWKGRLYLVKTVLGRWCERGDRWREETVSARPGPGGTLELVAPEQEVWRVEASRGRCFEVGIYELTREHHPAQCWRLVQVDD